MTPTDIEVRLNFSISLWSAIKFRLCRCTSEMLTDAIKVKVMGNEVKKEE